MVSPPGAETAFDVPFQQLWFFSIAFDQTQEQVEAILTDIKPDVVFYDLGHWIPALARQMGIKTIYCAMISAASNAHVTKNVRQEVAYQRFIDIPPGYPSSNVRLKPKEVAATEGLDEAPAAGLSFVDHAIACMEETDAIAFRTCREIEGPFCDYVAEHFGKTLLLTGTCFPETESKQLEGKWANWLSNFEPSSVVFCAFGSQITLQKQEFQELVLGFELSGLPFLVALRPSEGCLTIIEALPEGFQERVRGRGLIHGRWVPQELLLKQPSTGCFVNHCGFGTMLEPLLSNCQIVLIPHLVDQILNTRLMVEELKVAVQVDKGEKGLILRENLSEAIKLAMDKASEMAALLKRNHSELKQVLSNRDLQEEYINNFIRSLQNLIN